MFKPDVLLCNRLVVEDRVREFSRLKTSLDGFLANSVGIYLTMISFLKNKLQYLPWYSLML